MGYFSKGLSGRRWAAAIGALTVGPLLVALIVGLSSAGAQVRAKLTIGSAPVVPAHTKVLGSLAPATHLSVVVALAPRSASALSSYATAVSTPGSASYHDFLTVPEFRARFGATSATASAVRQLLAGDGLTLTSISANGLSFGASGTAAEIETAFGTTLDSVKLPGGRVAFTNTTAPKLAATLAPDVQAVIGLSNVFRPHTMGVTLHRASTHASANVVAPHATTAQADPALKDCAGSDAETTSNTGDTGSSFMPPLSSDAWTAQNLAQAYDYDPLYSAGDEGQGVTVGIFELEGNFPADITAFESCYGISTSVKYVSEDGGPAAPSASNHDGEETELDIENVAELAPDASILVYQADNSNNGLYDNYSAMVTNSAIKVISTSWGECESEETAGSATAESTLFQEAATQGISIAAAAGDSGAQDCELTLGPIAAPVGNDPTAAVDDPASQPYVTGVGGTDLEAIGAPPATKPTEAVWNDGTALVAATQGGAGGGGVSTLWPMPSYQSGAPKSLNVINSESSQTTCGALSGDCREVPDVTANAGLYTAFTIYYNGAWTEVGGTSGAAPLWASIFALADANAACKAKGSLGFANPVLYSVAGSSAANYAADFNDVTSGDNDALGTNGGAFAAGTGYDMASGLGSPVTSNLVPALCASAANNTATTTTAATTVTVPTVVTKTVASPTKTVVKTTTTKTKTKTPACHEVKTLSFVQHPAYPVRATKVLVYVNGKLSKTVKGKRIVDVLMKRPAATKFTLKLIVTLSSGQVISHQSTYNGCKVSKVTTKVLHKPV